MEQQAFAYEFASTDENAFGKYAAVAFFGQQRDRAVGGILGSVLLIALGVFLLADPFDSGPFPSRR